MAKMLKHFVFGQRKHNPPAPPRPDYEGEKYSLQTVQEPHYENISKFGCHNQVRFGDSRNELLVFDNYSEPADLLIEDALYVAPLEDRPSAPPLPDEEKEDVYCLPYDAPVQGEPPEDATYDVVPDDEPTEGAPDEYDEPWEWSVGARLTNSLQVSPSLEEDETMRRQRRLLYETAFDSRVSSAEDEVDVVSVGGANSRAASRSSFGSSTGSSASSTPTHRHQRHLAPHAARSASPPQSSRAPLNQNFERKISFSPQWCHPTDRTSSQESVGAANDRLLPPSRTAKSTSDTPKAEHRKENERSATEDEEHKGAQSPANDVRPCDDYDLPWDAQDRPPPPRVNGSKSVPEKLSELKPQPTAGAQARPNLNLGSNRGRRLTLDFGCSALGALGERINPQLSLEKQEWYHGSISRVDAEAKLRVLKEGSYLVRNSESSRQDYSLSLKSARGFMHMKIVATSEGRFVLGQFSKPFASIPEMIRHYSLNKLPIKGAEHMSLLHPCCEQLL